jgi:hypothetical protein
MYKRLDYNILHFYYLFLDIYSQEKQIGHKENKKWNWVKETWNIGNK